MPGNQEGLADKRGMILIISSPSGGGKTTLARKLVAEFKDEVIFSVSATTRPIRQGEKDGIDYHFVTDQKFEELVANGNFLEHAEVFGYKYDTLRSQVEEAIQKNLSVILDVDWQGAKSMLKEYREHAVGVFLFPPSLKELRSRLAKRMHGCSDEELEKRLKGAEEEMRKTQDEDCYNYILRNDNLDHCFQRLVNVFLAERCKRFRYKNLEKEISRIVTAS